MLGAATAAEALAMPAAKKPTATEMCEEKLRVGMEQTWLTYSYGYRKKGLLLPLNSRDLWGAVLKLTWAPRAAPLDVYVDLTSRSRRC